MNSLDQYRSQHAAAIAKEWKDKKPEDRREIATACKNLPVLLRINGLIAVLLEKAEAPEVKVLLTWLQAGEAKLGFKKDDSIPTKISSDRMLYRQAASEAIAYSIWLKRWVSATVDPGDLKKRNPKEKEEVKS